MDRDELSLIAHTDHPIACPVDDDDVTTLLTWLDVPPGGVVLDLGCGRAEWLLRLLAQRSDVRGMGVDRSARVIAAAQERAAALDLGGRARLVCDDAGACLDALEEPVDAALCIGATHALGGLVPALARLHALLHPGGRALVGALCWQRAPTAAALAALDAAAEDYPDLDGLVETMHGAGFEPLHVMCSSEDAWDRYEHAWCNAVERYARGQLLHLVAQAAEPPAAHPDAAAMMAAARKHRAAYVDGYRGVLGFAMLVIEAGA